MLNLFKFVTLRQINSFKKPKKIMRTFLRIKSEQRKKDIIELAKKSANTYVYGKYYKGCSLVKYTYPNYNVLLAIK